MRSESSTYTILGMLSIQPMSGYDIRKEIADSLAHFWHGGYGQIYPALKQLASQGMIEEQAGAAGGRADRKVFSLTTRGRAKLRDWLTQPPQTQTPRNELLLKLFFGRLVPSEASERHVLQFRQQQQQLNGACRELETQLLATQARHSDLAYWLMTISYGRHLSRALIAWSDETLQALRRERKDQTTRKPRAR